MPVLELLFFFMLVAAPALAIPLQDHTLLIAGPGKPVRVSIKHQGTLKPSIDADFPDPSLLQADDGTWVAFATNSGGRHVQVATAADPLGKWTLLPEDAMPENGWTNGRDFWAPDVRRLDNGDYILYFSGRLKATGHHCIGSARSSEILGPYKPDPRPIICHADLGGSIDPAGFKDARTGKRYVVYKIDGNAASPEVGTPLMLQEVKSDGSTPVGNPVEVLNRIGEDGALIEAPNIVGLENGIYLLFFSSHFFTSPDYDVKYAYSRSVSGPYTRASEPLIKAPDFGTNGPGGMTSNEEGNVLVFHGWCRERTRCMYSVRYKVYD